MFGPSILVSVLVVDELVLVECHVLSLDGQVDGSFELGVGLFLDGLGVLELLDEFHFQHLHLHDLGLLLPDYLLLFGYFSGDFLAGLLVLDAAVLLDLGLLDLFLLFLDLVLHHFLLEQVLVLLSVLILVLFGNELALLGLLLLVENNGVLDLPGLHIPLLLHDLDVVPVLLLPVLLGHLELHLFLGPLLILGLQSLHIVGPFLGLLYFLPRFHLLLLQ